MQPNSNEKLTLTRGHFSQLKKIWILSGCLVFWSVPNFSLYTFKIFNFAKIFWTPTIFFWLPIGRRRHVITDNFSYFYTGVIFLSLWPPGCLSKTVNSIFFAKIELRANSAYFLKIILKLQIKKEITISFWKK